LTKRLKKNRLSPEAAARITDEAITSGQKWDVQEKINARRQAEIDAACGLLGGKTQAPVKFDAAVPKPRCQAGAGAFGTYYVHPSKKYGVKVFRDPDSDVDMEFDLLDKAHAAGVNVPEPLHRNAIMDEYDEVRTQTMVISHMDGYKSASDIYPHADDGTIGAAPLILKVKAARQFRLLHAEGIAHGDIHNGNILINPRTKKVGLVDFGYATELDGPGHPNSYRTGVQNLMSDLNRLPDFLGFSHAEVQQFTKRYKGMFAHIEDRAEAAASNYSSNWESYELAVKRYHDALEQHLMAQDRLPRSRFVSSIDQPRIPGLTRGLLVANANTGQRGAMARMAVQPTLLQVGAKHLGVKTQRLIKALEPEISSQRRLRRARPFGTPFP
jgi:tRNA A-37 threonylcarbamoyl transferase component Bud32